MPLALSLSAALAALLAAPAVDPAAEPAARVALPAAVTMRLDAALPEGRRVGRALLSPAFDPNLVISAPTEVEVTFLRAKAAYRNAFGYFTWQLGPDGVEILDRRLIVEDASARALGPGKALVLTDAAGAPRTFAPGTRLGFFVVADAARRGDDATAAPSTRPERNARLAGGVFTTVDALNPEYRPGEPGRARHTAMVGLPGVEGFMDGAPFYAMGFEDRLRGGRSDEDFNDLVFAVRSRTPEALDETPVPRLAAEHVAPDADPDADGHHGLDDFFPDDPHRATVFYGPTVVLRGRDGGIVRAQTQRVRAADGRTHDLVATFAREAGAEAETLTLGGLPAGARGRLVIERFADDGTHHPPVTRDLASLLKPARPGAGASPTTVSLVVPELFGPGEGGEVRVALRFDTPLAVFPGKAEIPWRLAGVPPAARRIVTGPEAAPVSILPHPWRLRVAP